MADNFAEEMRFADDDPVEHAISLLETIVEIISVEVLRLRNRLPLVNFPGRIEGIRRWICGENLSLIRAIGSRFSLFQPQKSRFFLHLPTERSSSATEKEEEDNKVPVLSLADLDWLVNAEENVYPESEIRHRCEYYGFPFSPEVPRDWVCPGRRSMPPKMSTPNVDTGVCREVLHLPTAYYSTVLAANGAGASLLDCTGNFDQTVGGERIAALENELAKLKEQMALIIMAKEKKTEVGTTSEPERGRFLCVEDKRARDRSPSVGSQDSGISGEDNTPQARGASVGASQHPGVSAIPPAPAMPPNPDFLKNFSIKVPSMSSVAFKKEESCDAVKKGNKESNGGARASGVPSMAEVLRDLHMVKLRPTSRSPGGTPRKHRRSLADPENLPNDPGAFIAEALKRKFASVLEDSPASDKENTLQNSSWDATPETTPRREKHKSFKRRSSILTEDNK